MPELIRHLRIDAAFNGPPTSANGGYACGLVAEYIEGPASIRLHAPPPLDKTLALYRDGDSVSLMDGDTAVVSARPAEALQLQVPALPSGPQIEAATQRSIKTEDHIFPSCFVCGPERKAGDGLCVHVGPCDSDVEHLHAGLWPVDPAFTADDGLIASRFLWAALDCPSAYVNDIALGTVFLLGSLSGQIFHRPAVGETCRVIAWPLGREGRKHFAATAILNAQGQLQAHSQATWIELKDQGGR